MNFNQQLRFVLLQNEFYIKIKKNYIITITKDKK